MKKTVTFQPGKLNDNMGYWLPLLQNFILHWEAILIYGNIYVQKEK